MTEIPWKILALTVHSFTVNSPFIVGETKGALKIVRTTMMNIPTKANPDAFANFEISRFNDKG